MQLHYGPLISVKQTISYVKKSKFSDESWQPQKIIQVVIIL